MFEKIGIFILFLGPLVFFHELGHFLFARLFGVRVEVFSIGFGPKILKFKRGDTEYAVSLIPLGGYVKMFGDDPFNKDSVPVDERKFSFTHQGKWARFWIVFGGPLANFILAYVLFFGLFFSGERVPEVKIGAVAEQTVIYDLGFRSGDVLKNVNGKTITGPSDFALVGTELIQKVVVERMGEEKAISLNMKGEDFLTEFTKYPPYTLRRPVVVNNKGEQFFISLNDQSINWEESLEEIILKRVTDLYLVKLPKDADLGQPNLVLESEKGEKLQIAYTNYEEFFKALRNNNLYPLDLVAKSLAMKSAADLAGISAGDIILSLDGHELSSFEELRSQLQKIKEDKVKIVVLKTDGITRQYEVTPENRKIENEMVRLIGVYSSAVFNGVKFVDTPSKGFANSMLLAFPKTWEMMKKTFEGFTKLITGEVSFKNIGGPIAIGKVASDSFNTSISYFFQLMALFSLNLGIINLFPIPILDGGHILFIFLEIINRGPLSRRKMEIAQQMGLSVLLLLMGGAIFNDISKFF